MKNKRTLYGSGCKHHLFGANTPKPLARQEVVAILRWDVILHLFPKSDEVAGVIAEGAGSGENLHIVETCKFSLSRAHPL